MEKYNYDTFLKLKNSLKSLKFDKKRKTLNKRQLISMLAKDIAKKQKEGLPLSEIVEHLNKMDFKISLSSLKSTLSQLKEKKSS